MPTPARETKPRRPAAGTVTKRELSPAQAAEQWLKAHKAIEKHKALRDEAAGVLKPYFERRAITAYKGVGIVTNAARTVFDTEKLKAFLGKRLPEFQKETKPSKSLIVLGD